MKRFRKNIISILSVIFIWGCSYNESKSDQPTIAILDTHLSLEDKMIVNDIYLKIKNIVGKSTELNDPDLRNTDEKISVNADIDMGQFTTENFLEAINVIQTQLGGKLLKDNAKGGSIYCLGNKQTFEIHQPFAKSQYRYDMNDPKENMGIFKIVQLKNTWNVSMTVYKNAYNVCK